MPANARLLSAGPITLVAAGKAAVSMAVAFARADAAAIAAALVVSTHASARLPAGFEWYRASHPVPDAESERAGRRALELAAGAHGTLVCLLSGGASSLLAVPLPGITLEDKRTVTSRLLAAGADIHALNTVRKHLSATKGGRLAAASRGVTLAFAVSDVVGDDLSVIASGPTVPDPTTFHDALLVLDRFGGRAAYPPLAVRLLEAGARGDVPDTPKPGDPRLRSALSRVIGSRMDVVRACNEAATRLGYRSVAIEEPVVGEARRVGPEHLVRMLALAGEAGGRAAVISAGETTVHVTGTGRGGRNQEMVLAAAPVLARRRVTEAAFASIGTDGVDGPTDAAGAIADRTTMERMATAKLAVDDALDDNDSYTVFDTLGDLIRTGPTDTNVGDVQILLVEQGNQ